MSWGKLGVLRTYGEKPTFVILDEDGRPDVTIPDISDWLLKRVGRTVSLTYTDKYFELADLTQKG
uniref:Uncharacterized protein n=1 Tax=viral metagenome TaxID=1070528 RepID=A0A6M3ISJ0_9ZZZZ